MITIEKRDHIRLAKDQSSELNEESSVLKGIPEVFQLDMFPLVQFLAFKVDG